MAVGICSTTACCAKLISTSSGSRDKAATATAAAAAAAAGACFPVSSQCRQCSVLHRKRGSRGVARIATEKKCGEARAAGGLQWARTEAAREVLAGGG